MRPHEINCYGKDLGEQLELGKVSEVSGFWQHVVREETEDVV